MGHIGPLEMAHITLTNLKGVNMMPILASSLNIGQY